MPEKAEEAETVNLQSLGENKNAGRRNSTRREQFPARNKRVLIIGGLVTVCIIILIIVGAWFIYNSVSDSHPEWLQTIPGLHFQPNSSVRDSLIMFRSTDSQSFQPWIEIIDNFLKDYEEDVSNNHVSCSYNNPPPPGKVCHISLKDFHQCSKENLYGYHKGSPCIFLKIHKFPNWVPEYYNVSELPDLMPQHLKNHILLQTLWVSCEGETNNDKEFIGPLKYLPRMGFPGYFFPYRNIDGYLSPLVAIQLERPQVGIVINIECKLWAKNIAHDREKRIGLTRFELMVD
ncbi:hypothetical protein L9F63_013135 [Diploptera punctata]|uniref:Sodium/potassium-transporting ATPase subunit beta-2 n=1 Tax=Diploptera punctata TaxID=6984 RepID=A0AAD8AAX3_DIPPU|nr:hypothetical protein L9F63_013135 [Diploptera punctata]